jgi:hypothetical protein
VGAFLLYRNGAPVNRGAAETLFAAKGFGSASESVAGDWKLLHFRKQLLPDVALTAASGTVVLHAVGTFSYKMKGIQESLASIVADYSVGCLDQSALVGAYCFLFVGPNSISIMLDRQGLQHVFINDEATVISSSFAAVLKAGPKKYRLDRSAVAENALTGYVIGPDTVVAGIKMLDCQHQAKIPGIKVIPAGRDRGAPALAPNTGLDDAIEEQLAALDAYFSAWSPLVAEAGGVRIGLSGGYDSRLLVLLAVRHFQHVSSYSHLHAPPTADEIIACKIAETLNIPFESCAAAKQHVAMDTTEFQENVANTAAYFDGRVALDYNWLQFFRTRWYREQVLWPMRFSMNGLGGELYRNYDHRVYRTACSRAWVKARAMGPGVFSAIERVALEQVVDSVLEKATSRLGEDVSKKISDRQSRRYYGELFSVYCEAVRLNVDNQLAYSLSPFLDFPLRESVYRLRRQLGLGGRFARGLITRLNPSVAALMSSYGYAFDRPEPLSARFRFMLSGGIPNPVLNIMNPVRLHCRGEAAPVYATLYKQQPLVREAVDVMRSPCFSFKWDRVTQDPILALRVISIGLMLLAYQDCIDW